MEQSLEEEIEQIREAMLMIAGKTGLATDETLEISRRLDKLINELDALKESCRL